MITVHGRVKDHLAMDTMSIEHADSMIGKRVKINYKFGDQEILNITRRDKSYIYGETQSGKQRQIDRRDIKDWVVL